MTTEETTVEEETTYVKLAAGNGEDAAAAENGSDVRGGQSRQSVDAEQLTHMSHEESSRFVIKSVVDPRTQLEISMDQVVTGHYTRWLIIGLFTFYHPAFLNNSLSE